MLRKPRFINLVVARVRVIDVMLHCDQRKKTYEIRNKEPITHDKIKRTHRKKTVDSTYDLIFIDNTHTIVLVLSSTFVIVFCLL
jgi:hypothetical protein